jgi:hypothetical protein
MTDESTNGFDSPSSARGISWSHALCVGCFALAFVYFSYIPLWPTDIWGHVAYGEWILQHGELPTEDPFVDLARGTALIDTAWASQLIFASVIKFAGPEGLSCSFAILSVAIYLVMALLFALRTARLGLAVLCSGLTWLIAWERHLVLRPELFGYLLFAGLLALLTVTNVPGIGRPVRGSSEQHPSLARRWSIRFAMMLLIIVWTNLHGSFAVGLVALAVVFIGAVVEQWMNVRDLRETLLDSEVRESLILLVIAALATLVNPYGVVLPVYVIGFGTHPNMALISEWQAPDLTGVTGIAVLTVSVLYMASLKLRERRPVATELLLIGVFTCAVCTRQRMVTWYAPIAVLAMAPALTRCWRMFDSNKRFTRFIEVLDRRSNLAAAVSLLLFWIAFTFTPISRPVLGGRARSAEQLFNSRTPLGVTQALRQIKLASPVANPQWWGDWLSWAGPRDMRFMVTTNTLHLVPHDIFQNYHALCWAKPGLEGRLEEFQVETLIVDVTLQDELATFVRDSQRWKIEYEDATGLIATRRPRRP